MNTQTVKPEPKTVTVKAIVTKSNAQTKTAKVQSDTFAPVQMRALVQRINRKLRQNGEMLRASRGERAKFELGDFYILSDRNLILQKNVDPIELAQDLGVLKPYEKAKASQKSVEDHPTFKKNAGRMGMSLADYRQRVVPPAESLTEPMSLMLSKKDRDAVVRLADEHNLTISQFMHMVLQMALDRKRLSE